MSVRILNKFPRCLCSSISQSRSVRYYSKEKEDEDEIPVNLLRDIYSANNQPDNGVIYDNKPFKFTCEADKTYSWCLCGHSKRQPFCDGTHKNIFLKIKIRPILFKVKETKSYWLCNCKQTSNRPFCDGTHLREDIQEKKY
ncbi:uncharacterized protein LOC143184031 [Calliopsis andreniformis]|uniref:uncharacterized protein LOC143184031 n=1 Tax=Calliopsis andreniformis TaxID=337506 RepID=UPI003FCD7CEB